MTSPQTRFISCSVFVFHYNRQYKDACSFKKLHPTSNASNLAETACNSSSLFLLCFIDVSHPRSITPFAPRRPPLRLDACCSLPLLELSAACRYCIKPGRGIFLLFSRGKTPTMPRELIPISAWSLIRNVLGSRVSLRATNSPRQGFNLWGTRDSLVPARRRAQCRPGPAP